MRKRNWVVKLDDFYRVKKSTRVFYGITFTKMLTVKRNFKRRSV